MFSRTKKIKSRFYADTDAAFMDSANLPGFNTSQLEGRIVKTLTFKETAVIGFLFLTFTSVVVWKTFSMQVVNHDTYEKLSKENRLQSSPLFAYRGIIEDRFGVPLAWNEDNEKADIPTRSYYQSEALAHSIGYVRYPQKDAHGNWWRTTMEPKGGAEEVFDARLRGENGAVIQEVDASGAQISVAAIKQPVHGETVRLSLDARLTEDLYEAIKRGVIESKFRGGAGVIIDVTNGEVIAITSYPSFDPNAMASRNQEKIKAYIEDIRSPFVFRAMQGSYLPGSIIKPFLALAALEEGVITAEKEILSTGKLVLPNPYHPDKPSIFRDWKAHGWVNAVDAIAVSSDVYFYEVGGGFEDQRGLGIEKIDDWVRAFGFGSETGIAFPSESVGNIPTPEWKKEAFEDDRDWSIGNTYHSSIGQFGWLVTPLQSARAFAAIANKGTLFTPSIEYGASEKGPTISFSTANHDVVLEGMRQATKRGTAQSLNIPGIVIAGKTGTAEVGARKEKMHSWVVGFWPIEKPRFAFAVLLENGKAGTMVGAAPRMKPFFEHLVAIDSPYIRGEYPERKANTEAKDESKTEKIPVE